MKFSNPHVTSAKATTWHLGGGDMGWSKQTLIMACILADESDSAHKEACRTQDNSLSESEDSSSFTLDILYVGDIFDYTVPVITVKLQHVVVSVPAAEKGGTKQYDVFMKHSQGLQWRLPCCIKVLESCYVEVRNSSCYPKVVGCTIFAVAI